MKGKKKTIYCRLINDFDGLIPIDDFMISFLDTSSFIGA